MIVLWCVPIFIWIFCCWGKVQNIFLGPIAGIHNVETSCQAWQAKVLTKISSVWISTNSSSWFYHAGDWVATWVLIGIQSFRLHLRYRSLHRLLWLLECWWICHWVVFFSFLFSMLEYQCHFIWRGYENWSQVCLTTLYICTELFGHWYGMEAPLSWQVIYTYSYRQILCRICTYLLWWEKIGKVNERS